MRGGDVVPALNRQYERPQSAAPRGKIHNKMYDLNCKYGNLNPLAFCNTNGLYCAFE